MNPQWFVTVTALAAIAGAVATVPVFMGIVREARERRRQWRSGEMERYATDEAYDTEMPTVEELPPGSTVCRHCGTINDAGFRYCENCLEEM